MAETSSPSMASDTEPAEKATRVWYRTTLFNVFIIDGVGFLAPGLWNVMNFLGAGGAESPFLINAANALVFGLKANCSVIQIVLLPPVFYASYFNQYEGNFETYYFGVRARALIGFVAWVYEWVIQEEYTANPTSLDWSDKGYTRGLFVVLLWDQIDYRAFCVARRVLRRQSRMESTPVSGMVGACLLLSTRSFLIGKPDFFPIAFEKLIECNLCLDVLPTLLVIKSHVPIEHGSEAVTLTANRDE
ncbi:hypothetical protein N7492_009764 [Penicillium capsulatum]|uniref:Uncharacterized protein n=1 Tax=Penicillium capsulatum TaxID=69766 RepID=A0A9W9LF85_9EURO|nr:hypothetical protein N7492_009764 [Penicillium capsulatum]KAJ6114154.1 hypothetical protein N7512_007599 [Penicillium capsulatum]